MQLTGRIPKTSLFLSYALSFKTKPNQKLFSHSIIFYLVCFHANKAAYSFSDKGNTIFAFDGCTWSYTNIVRPLHTFWLYTKINSTDNVSTGKLIVTPDLPPKKKKEYLLTDEHANEILKECVIKVRILHRALF